MTRACVLLFICFSSLIVAMEIERMQLSYGGAVEGLNYHWRLSYKDKENERVLENVSKVKENARVLLDKANFNGKDFKFGVCYMDKQYSNFDECALNFKRFVDEITSKVNARRLTDRKLRAERVGALAGIFARAGLVILPRVAAVSARVATITSRIAAICTSPGFKLFGYAVEVGLFSYEIYDRVQAAKMMNDLEEVQRQLQLLTGKTLGPFVPVFRPLCNGELEKFMNTGATIRVQCIDNEYDY